MSIFILASVLVYFIFMSCLYMAAWQDYKTGEVEPWILIVSFFLTAALAFEQELPEAAAIFVILGALALFKKMGFADVIIFTQITFLYGIENFLCTLLLSSLCVLLWLIICIMHSGAPLKKLEELKKQEIRFVPFIAAAASIILTYDLIFTIWQ